MIGSMDCKRLGIVMLLVLMVSSTSIYAGRNDGDGAFGQRCREYLEYYSEHGDTTWLYGVFRQLARHGVGKPLESRLISERVRPGINSIRGWRRCRTMLWSIRIIPEGKICVIQIGRAHV